MTIHKKMLIPMITAALLIALGMLTTTLFIFNRYVEDVAQADIDLFVNAAILEYEDLFTQSTQLSSLIAVDADLQQALLATDRNALVAVTLELDSAIDADFLTILDPQGNVLVRAHEPDQFGDSLAYQLNIQRAIAGEQYTALEEGSAVKLSVRSSSPVYDNARNIIALVSTGYRLDAEGFVDHIKSISGMEAAIFLDGTSLASTIIAENGQRLLGTTAPTIATQSVSDGAEYRNYEQILGREAIVNYSPLRDVDGEIVAMLSIGLYNDAKDSVVKSLLLQAAIVTLVLLLTVSIVISILAKRIVRPIHEMVAVASRMADGEVDLEIEITSRDEMKSLADSFHRIIASSRQQAELIERIAQGDLSSEINLRSEKDVVGKALQKMLNLNNRVFSSINLASSHVANSAHQIADGAQNLAHGSAEQAGVIEELSAAVYNVAALSSENAGKALKAAKLAEIIRGNAEQGSSQMNSLTQAVNEINDASQAISNVIKVIDDIAFQTNILALNAAVEAARAGEHGKGFAVVADEVRNLASKSAEAAHDTGTMITNSIKKAEFGASVATGTAHSLAEIVAGINESYQMVSEIAASAERASDAIKKINIGIDQVALVVQQNSATAEQSAASSEEMSSQSQMLRNQVSQFRFKSSDGESVYENSYDFH